MVPPKKILYVVITFLLGSFVLLFPYYVDANGYELKLFYETDTQTLRRDKFADQVISRKENINITYYDLIDQPQKQNTYNVQFISNSGPLSHTVQFSPKSGAFTVEVPYLSHAQKLRILSPQGDQILTFDTSKFAKCNQNRVCEYENGETQDTCISDCVAPEGENIQFSEQTKQKLQAQNGVIRNEEGTVLLEDNQTNADDTDSSAISNTSDANVWVLLGGILLIGLAGGVWIYITFFKDDE